MKTALRTAFLPLMMIALSGCAGLGLEQVLQAPTFRVDGSQQAHLRLLGPSMQNPLGGAAVRLYARVGNPNPVGLTLTRLVGQLSLEGTNAARVDFPLGVPLQAGGETMVPIDIAISFNDLPGLATGGRETIVTSPIEAEPQYLLRLPGPSWLPLLAGLVREHPALARAGVRLPRRGEGHPGRQRHQDRRGSQEVDHRSSSGPAQRRPAAAVPQLHAEARRRGLSRPHQGARSSPLGRRRAETGRKVGV